MGANTTIEELLEAVESMIDSAIAEHVEEYHEGEAAMDDDSGEATSEMTTMSDVATANDLAIKMGEEKARADRATSDSERLTLQLKDAEGKATTLADRVKQVEAVVSEREAEIVTLKAEITKRDNDAADVRVNDAFDTYKDAHKLTDAHKSMMRGFLLSQPSEFDKIYPRVAPQHKHLMRDLTGSRTPTQATAPGQASPLPVSTTGNQGNGNSTAMMLTLKDKYLKEGMEPAEAFKRAIRETRASN